MTYDTHFKIILLLLVVSLTACTSKNNITDQPILFIEKIQPPSDFSLQFLILSDPYSLDPQTQTTRYLITPDRNLYICTGEIANKNTRPKLYKKLTWPQYNQIYQTINQHLLHSEQSTLKSATQTSQTPTIYCVTITTNSNTHHFITTPKKTKSAKILLNELIKLRGYKPNPVR